MEKVPFLTDLEVEAAMVKTCVHAVASLLENEMIDAFVAVDVLRNIVSGLPNTEGEVE